MNSADILLRIKGGWELERKWKGGPEDRRRRIVDALACCYVMDTDRIVYDKAMIVPCRSLIPYLKPVNNPDSGWWSWTYTRQHPCCVTPVREATRKEVLARIAKGSLGIEDKIGIWNGSFWQGLRLSGAIKSGPGTELRIMEKAHPEILSDLVNMPLMKRLEPKVAKHGQRRLRRCFAAFLPPEDPVGRSVLAGLFAGAILRHTKGEKWLELPDTERVRAILGEWGIPFFPLERPMDRRVIHVSPLFGALVSHMMPPHSAGRILSIRKAGGCPYLSAILWEMTMARRNIRYMPFPNALPFACSKSTFFRRGWRRRDLHQAGWLQLGIRVTPKLRELLVEWYQRRMVERDGSSCDASSHPLSPGIAPMSFTPPFSLR